MFVLRSTYEQVCLERDIYRDTARKLNAENFEIRNESANLIGEVAGLRAEIADRHRSETDAREQLRELKAQRSAAVAKGNRTRALRRQAA